MPGGRPPKLRSCAKCLAMKPRRAFTSATADVCAACRKEIRDGGGPRGVSGGDLSYTDQNGVPGVEMRMPFVPMKAEIREHVMDAINLDTMSLKLKQLFKPMPRCECCYEYRHVARDGYGGVAMVCARCSYQICATGTCHLHHARVYYPELAAEHDARGKPGPVPSPPEVESLFYVPEQDHSKYDPAELADADV